MELKYTYTFKDLAITYRFNRTFMELKLSIIFTFSSFKLVLIVPLWN